MSQFEADDLHNREMFWEAVWNDHQEDARKRLEYSSMYAASAIKSLFLLNGGSIISLLTFIGNHQVDFGKRGLFWAFAWFASGIFLALVSYFGAYFSQSFFMNASYARAHEALGNKLHLSVVAEAEKPTASGNMWICIAVSSAALSAMLFGVGAFVTLFAIL